MRRFAIVPAILVAASCAEPGSAKEVSTPSEEEQEFSTALPATEITSNCIDSPTSSIEVCSWVQSFHAVVEGEVLDITPVNSPSMEATTDGELVDDCEGLVEPSMIIRLRVDEAFHGEELRSGSVVDVHVGRSEMGSWRPMPAFNGSTLDWGGEQGFEVGQKLGMTLFHSDSLGSWATLGQPLFVTQDDELRFQPALREDDCNPKLPEAAQTSYILSRDAVAACNSAPSDEALGYRQRAIANWEINPAEFLYGVCHVSDRQ